MNKYDERYDIRLAKKDEIPDVMRFINDHWKKGHLLSLDRTLFEYEFVENDEVHVMVAIDKNTETIEAFAGFLYCSHTEDNGKKDIWGSFWKVNDSRKNMTFLGVELVKRLAELVHCRSHLGIGINPNTTLPIRKLAFHEKTAKMDHFYCLNPDFDTYKIAVVNNFRGKKMASDMPATDFLEFHSVDEIKQVFNIEALDTIPYKDFWYINKRFYQHPYYSYRVYGLKNTEDQVRALLIGREVSQFDRTVFRIVDYIGEQSLFAGIGGMIRQMMREKQYEYVDFYTYGFETSYILDAGFVLKDESDSNIIPNYFEPFVQENIDIWVRYQFENTVFFKADGDQDRPNILR